MNKVQSYFTSISSDNYMPGVLVLDYNLKKLNSKYPLSVLVSKNVTNKVRKKLISKNIKILEVEESLNEFMPTNANQSKFKHWSSTLDKLLLFKFTQYDKIVFLDSDLLIYENLDFLFEKEHLTAPRAEAIIYDWNYLNSSTLVIVPSKQFYDVLYNEYLAIIEEKESFGDQDVINKTVPDWNLKYELILPPKYNVYIYHLEAYIKQHGFNFSKYKSEKSIAIIHFAGAVKPWMFGNWRRIWYGVTRLQLNFLRATFKYMYYLIKAS